MANIARVEIDTKGEWVDLATLIAEKVPGFDFVVDTEYGLQSFGINYVKISDDQPTEDGYEVFDKEKFRYHKDTETEKFWIKNVYKAELNIAE